MRRSLAEVRCEGSQGAMTTGVNDYDLLPLFLISQNVGCGSIADEQRMNRVGLLLRNVDASGSAVLSDCRLFLLALGNPDG
jgi:hypothetical protein